MAKHPVSHYLETAIQPFSFLGLLIALFALFGPYDVPGLSFLSIGARTFFESQITQFVFALTKPIQFIVIVHIFRRDVVRRELDRITKFSLFGLGMQAFPIVVLWQAFEIPWKLLRGGNVEDCWAIAARYWKDYMVSVLILVALALEFQCEKGIPPVMPWIDAIIDKIEVDDAMEKGSDEKPKIEI